MNENNDDEPQTLKEALAMDFMAGSSCLFSASGKCYPINYGHADRFIEKHGLTTEDIQRESSDKIY